LVEQARFINSNVHVMTYQIESSTEAARKPYVVSGCY
jgi:hypothetical protein